MDYFSYKRRLSSVVQTGNTPLGGTYPIRIQSMTNVSTMDTGAAVDQAIRMIKAGAEYVRFTARGEREAQNLRNIRKELDKKGYDAPLIADIHFNPKAADMAALYVEKVRINPGNYVDKSRKFERIAYSDKDYTKELQKIRDRFVPFLKLCRENNTAIRIGVNHGSLSDRIMSRYGDTPEGMVESCMEFLRLCADEKFDNVVISVKASNTVVMISAVRLLVRTMDTEGMNYPLHLGVTEAGDGEDGRIKSAVGIGALLVDGYGDTIRVSLSEEPEAEIPVARKLVDYVAELGNHSPINAVASPLYDPIHTSRRKSRVVHGIGGDLPPVVLSDRTDGDKTVDNNLKPDWIYATPENISGMPFCENYIIDAKNWNSQTGAFPCFSISERDELIKCNAKAKFISLTYNDLNKEIIRLLQTDKNTIAIVNSSHINYIGETRAFMHRLLDESCDVPVIFRRKYDDTDRESIQIKAAVDFGTLLADGFGNGIMLCNNKDKSGCDAKILDNYMFGILQAARVRISKTEYISCPGCGRTLFGLQKTIAQVKAATSQMKGLKIGIMGCIVNGPGEMADADYGYVGAGRGRVSLYKGKECILKNIPEEEAVTKLIELINKPENV
ncbi:MAG: 4-hydroxy-3-methylbut-2-en-1-yl diphosphate synthase [Tannerella sp.]|jgi:(E)-4-hydroxy-3-methylbut-2-enyl-diphosphate synthase|nr:4-hydroxy-3-methylbut-2-en-1-yl diphosphate synthase [Tannerella sp.]